MVNAGRILIIPKGDWSSLVSYDMLDLVSQNGIAYIARQASVGVNPSTDLQYTYWQPFGSAAEIATTSKAGIVMPNGTTITVDANGLIAANVGISDITDVDILSPATGDILRFNANTQKWENVNISSIQSAVEQIIAPVEDSTTTSRSYAVGESFIRNNVLYKAKLPISQGTSWSSLVLNTDYEAAPSVSAQNQTLTNAVSTNTTNIGTLANLPTTDKSSLVGAITEVNTSVSGKASTTDVNNKHKVTAFEVTTSGWSADITSQSGVTLQKKSISLSHAYVDCPSVDIGAASGSVLPTTAQQTAYDLLQYVTLDGTTLYLYASDVPTDAFYINVEGAD